MGVFPKRTLIESGFEGPSRDKHRHSLGRDTDDFR